MLHRDIKLTNNILENQEMLKKNWEIQLLVRDIVNNQFVMPNATVAKTYKTAFEPARQISNKIETWIVKLKMSTCCETRHVKQNMGLNSKNG